ncbi:MAG: hypothetical protein CEN89_255 [Candidatus Berkelbacteria bacterium Licking1014_7]|uniref:Glycosyltransferase RgtA/B/C/D-like domain-containing protein n=1 Tax=Candidatus Berkelbacteria bacterium Licking1014_7 TaxID=2017147 RepID=A0A554LJU8_9BACT|nr:MAG: hypothetical protein CEN89_255 [Candidatus Berkelbacteria bacterium Licking1014_7]
MTQEILLNILIVVILFISSFGIGNIVNQYLKNRNSWIIVLGIGLGIHGFLIYFFGLLHLLNIYTISIILGFGFLLFFIKIKFNRIKLPKIKIFEFFLLFIIGLILFMFVINTLAPAIKFDDTWYHLTEVKMYLLEGKIRAFLPPAQLGQSSITPRLVDMLYAFPLAFLPNSSVGAKIIHMLLGVGALVVVFEIGKLLFNKRTGLISSLILSTIPIFGWLAQTAYIDLGVIFYVCLTFLLYVKWRFREKTNLFLLALLLGFALSTKLWIIGFWLVLLVDALVAKKKIKEILFIFCGSFLILMPWLLESFYWTGNPIFPLFSGGDQSGFLGGANTIWEWLLKIYWVKLIPTLEDVMTHSLPWLLLLPLLIFTLRHQTKIKLWLLTIGLILILMWAVIPWRDDRFLVPFSMPLIILVAAIIEQITAKNKFYLLSFIPLIGLIIFQLIALASRSAMYYSVISNQTAKNDFMAEKVAKNIWGCYDNEGKIKKLVLPSGKKTLVFCHNMFYLDFPFDDSFDAIPKTSYSSSKDFVSFLHQHNYDFVLFKLPVYPEGELAKLINVNLPENFFSDNFKLLYDGKENGLKLYEIL